MRSTKPITKLLHRLWIHMNPSRRYQFSLLLMLMILASFTEALSIGAVVPFLAILTDPAHVFMHPSLQPIIQFFGYTESKQLILPLTIFFGLAAIFAGIMRLSLLWASTRLSYAAGTDLSIRIYRLTLYQPYAVHVARNSSEIINGITTKTGNAVYIINMVINFISSTVMLIIILIALLYIEPVVALSAFCGFGLIYIFIIGLTRHRLLINSQTIARESTYVIKLLQEGLGGIRDVLIDGSQEIYCNNYYNADQRLRIAQGNSSFISSSPRFCMEALGMLLISILAYFLAKQPDGVAKAIPILGALALGAQRLLPALQQTYAAWTGIQGGRASLQDTLELLDQPLPDYVYQTEVSSLPFRQQITLKQLHFCYSLQTTWVLQDINLTITKGSRVGFIGVSGSGKSTLIDIIMGLLYPTNGAIEIDCQPITSDNNRAWQTHIAHVPQAIYLADTTIEENIAFGVPRDQIDGVRVRQAAYQAQIAEVIDSWPKKYQTVVGERGVCLSGGQRQRIGIARAFYKKADVIILDEATSALDIETEQSVMQAIEDLGSDITLLIIAHRLSTLKNCTQIVKLSNGTIDIVGSYEEIVGKVLQ